MLPQRVIRYVSRFRDMLAFFCLRDRLSQLIDPVSAGSFFLMSLPSRIHWLFRRLQAWRLDCAAYRFKMPCLFSIVC